MSSQFSYIDESVSQNQGNNYRLVRCRPGILPYSSDLDKFFNTSWRQLRVYVGVKYLCSPNIKSLYIMNLKMVIQESYLLQAM